MYIFLFFSQEASHFYPNLHISHESVVTDSAPHCNVKKEEELYASSKFPSLEVSALSRGEKYGKSVNGLFCYHFNSLQEGKPSWYLVV